MRTNELDVGVWLIRTEGEAAPVLAMDATLQALKAHWLVRETIGYLRRTFSRLDVTSRSLFALVEQGSCFAGTLFELALACDRIYHLALPGDDAGAPKIVVGEANFGDYPMATGQSRLGRRFYDEAPALEAVKAKIGEPLDANAAFTLGLATRNPDDIDWAEEVRIAIEERVSMSPRRPHRDGGEPAFRRSGDDGHQGVRPPDGLAELDLPAAERGRRKRRAESLWQGRKGGVRLEPGIGRSPGRRDMEQAQAEVIRQHLIDPEICIRCNTCEATCPVGAITHDARNYVVDAEKCNLCMACIPPCPTGSIDNWRILPRTRAYSVDAQFGWDELPPELSAGELAAAGVASDVGPRQGSRRPSRPASRAARPRSTSPPTPPSRLRGPPPMLTRTSTDREPARGR